MPLVPDYNTKPLRPIYNPTDIHGPATHKQRDTIITACKRLKIRVPDLHNLTKGQASELISRLDSRRD